MGSINREERKTEKTIEERLNLVEHGYDLNALINDENKLVRAAVTKQGFGLDILLNNEEWVVVNDKNLKVREIALKTRIFRA